MADFWSSIALGGWGCSAHFKNHRLQSTSADGGRYARIDEMVDNDGPWQANAQEEGGVGHAGIAPEVNSHGKDLMEHLHKHGHVSKRKHFFISPHSATGGSGLHPRYEEKD